MSDYRIGDEVYIHGIIDEIRKDTIIIKNEGGYFGTVADEIMPSAQPEPCDDPRADIYYLAEKIGIHRLYALVVELRGEPEPCEDAVSREAVSSWLKQYGQDVLHGKYKFSLMYIWKNLMDLPSVQPELRRGERS